MKVIQRNSLLSQASRTFPTVPVHLVFPETKEERMRKVEPGPSPPPPLTWTHWFSSWTKKSFWAWRAPGALEEQAPHWIKMMK